MTVGIIIQARMGSTRLPGKVLRVMGDKPLLGHIVHRLHTLKTPAKIIVATSNLPADDAIAHWCVANSVACFRGNEQDVLDRYFTCATEHKLAHIVRLTGDNPFTDTEELDRLIELHMSSDHDYSHSFGQLPIGVGAEIFTLDALRRSHTEGFAPHHREHVNDYILEHSPLFRVGTLEVPAEKRAPTIRLTVDTEEDFTRASRLMAQSPNDPLSTESMIGLCSPSA